MKRIAMLMSLMLLLITAGVSLATEEAAKVAAEPVIVEMLSGEVVSVDAAAGTIVVKANEEDRTLTGEPKLLEGINDGALVNIEVTGDMLKSIKQIEAPAVK